MRKFLLFCFFLVIASNLGLANKLPNVTAPALPANIPTADPITLIGELSPQCQAAFLSIITSPEFFECVPVAALLPVLTDPTLLPSVLSDPLNNAPKLLPVVNAICAVPKCSDSGVANALQSVKEGCSSKDDQKNPIVQLAVGVITFYSPVRDIICFENNKKELCIVETVTNILTLPAPPIKLLGGIIDKLIFAEPKSICTPCNKAIVNTLIDFFTANPDAIDLLEEAFHIGEEELKIGEFYFAIKCGAPFVDGKVGDPTTDPKDFEYQEADNGSKSEATKIEKLSYFLVGTLGVASTLVLQ